MSKKLVVLANDRPGLEVVKYLISSGENIFRLYIHREKYRKCGKEIIDASKCNEHDIFEDYLLKDQKHILELKELLPDFIVSVYWKWLLNKEVLQCATQGNVNFHPALLPLGRGWYPLVMSLYKGYPPIGVTLHQMNEGMDTGPIWAQKEVDVYPIDTCDKVYYRLQKEIVELFKEKWPLIASGKIKPIPQDEKNAITYYKSDINTLDKIDLNKEGTFNEFINLLRARSFGNKGFAYYEVNNQKIYVNIRLGNDSNFE